MHEAFFHDLNQLFYSCHRYHVTMDTVTIVVGGALVLLLSGFMFRLFFTIIVNLFNGRKFHHSLEKQFDQLRLSNMLTALGINKTRYIYQTNVNDIQQQMSSCSVCTNTDICDEKLTNTDIDIAEIAFCNNEANLINIKKQQIDQQPKRDESEKS